MKVRNLVLVVVGIVLVLTFVYFGFFYGEALGLVVLGEDNGYRTVAICNESGFCEDWRVWCEEGKVVERILIEGTEFWGGEGWVDPRGNLSICE